MFKRSGSALILAVALAACAHPPLKQGGACASLPNGGEYCLQSSTGVPPVAHQQVADFQMGDQRHRLIVQWEADAHGMRVAGLTPLGQSLFQTQFDNQRVHNEVLLDSRMRPELLLALLQIAHWPIASVQAGLPSSMTVEEEGARRRIRSGVRTVLTVEREGEASSTQRLKVGGLGWEVIVTPIKAPPTSTP